MRDWIPSFLLVRPSLGSFRLEGKAKISFLEKGLHHIGEAISTAYWQWESTSRNGFLQGVDARVKILFMAFFLVIVSLKRDIGSAILISLFFFVLAILSQLKITYFYRKILFLTFVFGFLIALPSALNVAREGELVLPIFHFSKSRELWIYHIPETIGFTKEGLHGVAVLTLRVFNSLSLSFLILHTTSFPEILKALRVLKIPDTLLLIIGLSYKYFLLFARILEEMYLAKKSRLIRDLGHGSARRWIAGRITFIFGKTQQRGEEVFKAMLSRGFSGPIHISVFAKLGRWDWSVGTFLFLAGVLILWI
jgi:energy-coupling factor transporter transmembrane protein EcfT